MWSENKVVNWLSKFAQRPSVAENKVVNWTELNGFEHALDANQRRSAAEPTPAAAASRPSTAAAAPSELWLGDVALEHGQLMAEGQVFQHELPVSLEPGAEDAEEGRNQREHGRTGWLAARKTHPFWPATQFSLPTARAPERTPLGPTINLPCRLRISHSNGDHFR
jgi:hypothetical protein